MAEHDAKTLASAGGESASRAPTIPATPTSERLDTEDLVTPGPGAIIDGAFRVVDQLGSGAMGVVLLAHDERLQRDVAIKLIRPELSWADFRERFVMEARAMARVNHPNVLHIHAIGEHDSRPYFVMELVQGQTLEQWVADHRAAPDIDAAVRILEDMCRGVTAIHEADTLHRDLKPSNILLDLELRPRVADLGLAVLCRGPSKTEVVGTPAYMAPEIAGEDPIDVALRPRADVYSLGCMAYEMLTGARPFDAAGDLAKLLHKESGPILSPSARRPGLPEAFDDAILHALAEDPRERTPTVEAFRRALVAAHEGRSEPDRILVAEDDEDFRALLQASLGREFPDADLECVADGRAALDAFDRKRPSVVLLDLNIPTIDGLALTGLLRARESSATTPILVLTGSGGPDEWKRLSAMGADRFLVKPVNLDDVVGLVRRALRERSGAASHRPHA